LPERAQRSKQTSHSRLSEPCSPGWDHLLPRDQHLSSRRRVKLNSKAFLDFSPRRENLAWARYSIAQQFTLRLGKRDP